MSPNKLFDYLDGKLAAREREQLERQIVINPVLQRELAIARKLHNGIRDASEVIASLDDPSTNRGAILSRRVALAFIVLVFLNVLIGVWFIFHQEKKRSAGSGETGIRRQVEQSVEKAATSAFPLPNLESDEIKIVAPVSETAAIASKTIAAAVADGGSGAQALADENGTIILIDIPKDREIDFRDQLAKLGAELPAINNSTKPANPNERKFLQIRIVKAGADKKP